MDNVIEGVHLMPWDTSSNPSGRVATASLADLDVTGVYALEAPKDLTDLLLVRRARKGHRYVHRFGPVTRAVHRNPVIDGGLHISFPKGHLLGARILGDIGPGDRVPDAQLLRMLAVAGPYDLCGICHRPTSDAYFRHYDKQDQGEVTDAFAKEYSRGKPDWAPSTPTTASTSDIQKMFGFGSGCIGKHLALRPKILQVMYRAQIAAGIDQLSRWANEVHE